jgi:predicted nucleic acid-binding protein
VTFVYDAAVLVGADRSERDVWADHRARLELGVPPITTAPVVAQVSRSERQAQLRRFLRGCDVLPFRPTESHAVGRLLAKSETFDVVDAHVALVASSLGSTIVTDDVSDLRRLSSVLPAPVPVMAVSSRRRRRT